MAVARQRFEVFRFPVMQSTFCFSNIAIITIPAASLINYFTPKGAAESVFIGKTDLRRNPVENFVSPLCVFPLCDRIPFSVDGSGKMGC